VLNTSIHCRYKFKFIIWLTNASGETGGAWRDPAEPPEVVATSITMLTSDAGLAAALTRDGVTRTRQWTHRVALTLIWRIQTKVRVVRKQQEEGGVEWSEVGVGCPLYTEAGICGGGPANFPECFELSGLKNSFFAFVLRKTIFVASNRDMGA